MTENLEEQIYDWNLAGDVPTRPLSRKVEFDDETLRDGLQSPSVKQPSIEEKLRILHFMHALGIDNADIGLPSAGPHVQEHVEHLAREIVQNKLCVAPSAAGLMTRKDVILIKEISDRVGRPIEADLFIGSSPIRLFAEGWGIDSIVAQCAGVVEFAVQNEIPLMFVTEDTTRAKPEDIEKLYSAAIRAGAVRVCVADTVGHATPWGVRSLIRFVREIVARVNPAVKIDWHGHQDRGLGVINSIAALEAGADRVHGTAAGIGERVGNTPIDLMMVNLQLMGWIDRDLAVLSEYVNFVSNATGVPLPDQYPVFGRDAFRTATGVHASAIIKAREKGSDWLADRVYSGVPAGQFGLRQVIEVGPMSGQSNVIYWLAVNGYRVEESLTKVILDMAKSKGRVSTDDELRLCADRWQEAQGNAH